MSSPDVSQLWGGGGLFLTRIPKIKLKPKKPHLGFRVYRETLCFALLTPQANQENPRNGPAATKAALLREPEGDRPTRLRAATCFDGARRWLRE